MSDPGGQPDRIDPIEELVEEFLDRREQDPSLTPERFAADHADEERLLPALHATLEVMATLGDGADAVPDRIGDFDVVREIGRGGMGVVYEVERGGERRALKRLGVAALLQPRARQRFQREANALMRLRHPGVVVVHEVGIADGLPFLVMDLVEGRSLEDMGPLPWRQAVELCRDLGRALAAVHEAGLCHRDLKPQNVLIGSDGRPVLVDFGLVHDAADVTLTGTGDLLGTPRYLAPEQAAGEPADARSDLHALGLILAELLTGRPVRGGNDRSSLLAEVAAGRVPDLSGVRDVPPALVRVVRTATALRPQWRYKAARPLVEDLERVLAGRPVLARPPGSLRRGVHALRQRPRLAAAWGAALLIVATAVWLSSAQWIAATRGARASKAFDDAVLAWREDDEAATRRGIDATLADAPDHAGALALRFLCGADAAWEPDGGRARLLRTGLAERAAQRWPAAAAPFRAAVDAEPTCPLSRILLAEALERTGELPEAERELTMAAELLPDSAALALTLGALQLRRGDGREAASSYRRLVELRPDSLAARYRLARACYTFDAEAALAEIGRALELPGPFEVADRHRAERLRAALLDKLGRTEEALPILERLAAECPDDVAACFNLGYTLDRLLRVREAKVWYEKALAIDPHNESATLCLVWLLITAEDDDLRDVDRAEKLLLGALEHSGGDSDAVRRMVRDFALKTGRAGGLDAALTRAMARPGVSAHLRGELEHLRNNVRSAVPGTGR